MYGLGIGDLGCRNNGRHIEVALSRWRRADANGFFCQFDVFGFTVRLGIDHDSLDSQFAASALYPQGNFATVGDQDFFEHERVRLFDEEQGLSVFHGLPVVTQNFGDGARLVGLDFVEDFHGLDDADGFAFPDAVTHFDKSLGTRRG